MVCYFKKDLADFFFLLFLQTYTVYIYLVSIHGSSQMLFTMVTDIFFDSSLLMLKRPWPL
jgi:hypothetical protein